MSNKRRIKTPPLPRHDVRLADGRLLRYRGHSGNVARWADDYGLTVALQYKRTPVGQIKMLGIFLGDGHAPPDYLNGIIDALIGPDVEVWLRVDERTGWIYAYEAPRQRSAVVAENLVKHGIHSSFHADAPHDRGLLAPVKQVGTGTRQLESLVKPSISSKFPVQMLTDLDAGGLADGT